MAIWNGLRIVNIEMETTLNPLGAVAIHPKSGEIIKRPLLRARLLRDEALPRRVRL